MSGLNQHDFARLMHIFEPFEPVPHVAVAVSGGADSMALTCLLQHWVQARGGKLTALTVDHGLRHESADEARWVAGFLAEQGISHAILPWLGPKPSGDVQAAARRARYDLLTEYCRRHGILHLVFAHHQDDQAETVMLRLARGSGVDGLAAMPALQEMWDVRVLRPVLGWSKTDLMAVAAAHHWPWINDPSNSSPRYQRVVWRQMADQLTKAGLSTHRLAGTAKAMAATRCALDRQGEAIVSGCVDLHPCGFAWLNPAALAEAPLMMGERILARLLQMVSGSPYAPRYQAVHRLYQSMVLDQGAAATLAGCRLARQGPDRILICREARACQGRLPLTAQQVCLWDGRFRIQCSATLLPECEIGPLGEQGWRILLKNKDFSGLEQVPALARPTIPTIFCQQAISAVPLLRYKQTVMRGIGGLTIGWAPPVSLTSAGSYLVS